MKRLEVDVYLDVVSCTKQAFGRLEVLIKSVSRSHRRACSLPIAASQSPLSERAKSAKTYLNISEYIVVSGKD
ncbi:hypothetical protein Taro_017229 [Colocasia esculenta]|uniref:Uncharacterized protein n=1 Tax=Colocasia esculenta TaxID=4460 RepID=A0A843UML2_COLES|nr:hypothetical protein [Colocasia esculenta]